MSSDRHDYIAWWRNRCPLFHAGDTWWRLHDRRALMPVTVGPCFPDIAREQCAELLEQSGAWFVRYSSHPCEERTDWWYVLCDRYDPADLSGNTRSKLSRGLRRCAARRVDLPWLAEHGYACYRAAFDRYTNATPRSRESFRNGVLDAATGPFEYWGVFVGDSLAGYCRCAVDRNHVSTEIIKFDPDGLKNYSAYAMVGTLLQHYVNERGMVINNGNPAVSHDTLFQEFLLKLGYRQAYCRLNVVYRRWLGAAVNVVFPFRRALPDRGRFAPARSLLLQEQIRRSCARLP